MTTPPVRFDSEFIERRMREFREWCKRREDQEALEILQEVAACLEVPRLE